MSPESPIINTSRLEKGWLSRNVITTTGALVGGIIGYNLSGNLALGILSGFGCGILTNIADRKIRRY